MVVKFMQKNMTSDQFTLAMNAVYRELMGIILSTFMICGECFMSHHMDFRHEPIRMTHGSCRLGVLELSSRYNIDSICIIYMII